MHTGADPFGSDPRLEWIGLACTRDLPNPIQFGSTLRTSIGLNENRSITALLPCARSLKINDEASTCYNENGRCQTFKRALPQTISGTRQWYRWGLDLLNPS